MLVRAEREVIQSAPSIEVGKVLGTFVNSPLLQIV